MVETFLLIKHELKGIKQTFNKIFIKMKIIFIHWQYFKWNMTRHLSFKAWDFGNVYVYIGIHINIYGQNNNIHTVWVSCLQKWLCSFQEMIVVFYICGDNQCLLATFCPRITMSIFHLWAICLVFDGLGLAESRPYWWSHLTGMHQRFHSMGC